MTTPFCHGRPPSGIGLELARIFAANRYDVVLVARSDGKLRESAVRSWRPRSSGDARRGRILSLASTAAFVPASRNAAKSGSLRRKDLLTGSSHVETICVGVRHERIA